MVKNIYNTKLVELLPPNLQTEPEVISLGAAFDHLYSQLTAVIGACALWDIDVLPSAVVDEIALERGTDYYSQSLPLARQRALVKNALKNKFKKGTPAAVEFIVNNAFGGTATVLEWFDYGGEPYMFKVVFDTNSFDFDTLTRVLDAISIVANVRSHLDAVVYRKTTELNFYLGFAIKQTRQIKVVKKL